MTEKGLSQKLDNLFVKYSKDIIKIEIPDPNDLATLDTWNNIKRSISSSIYLVDNNIAKLRQSLDSFDESSSMYSRQIESLVQKSKELLITSTINPDEEIFFENFKTGDSISDDSVIGWDENTKALSLPIESEISVVNSISDMEIIHDADTNEVRRNIGHIAGHVENNTDNRDIIEADDKLNLNSDISVLVSDSSSNTIEVEQVYIIRDQGGSYNGVKGTENYLVNKYNHHGLGQTNIPDSEQVLWSRKAINGYDAHQKVTIKVLFKSPININKTVLVQQPIDGKLATLISVKVILENGQLKSIQEFSEMSSIMGNAFSTQKIKGIRWELIQTHSARSPLSMQHWVANVSLNLNERARHLFVDSALLNQKNSLDGLTELRIDEKILNAGKPIRVLSDNELPPWARKGPKLKL